MDMALVEAAAAVIFHLLAPFPQTQSLVVQMVFKQEMEEEVHLVFQVHSLLMALLEVELGELAL